MAETKDRFKDRKNHPLATRVLALDINNNEYIFDCIKDATDYFGANYQTTSTGLRRSLDVDGWYTNRKTGVKFKRMDEGSY